MNRKTAIDPISLSPPTSLYGWLPDVHSLRPDWIAVAHLLFTARLRSWYSDLARVDVPLLMVGAVIPQMDRTTSYRLLSFGAAKTRANTSPDHRITTDELLLRLSNHENFLIMINPPDKPTLLNMTENVLLYWRKTKTDQGQGRRHLTSDYSR